MNIDLLAGLRGIEGVTVTGGTIVVDDSATAQLIAEAAAEEIRENIKAGNSPDGSAAPPLAAETIKRKHSTVRGVKTGRFVETIQAKPDGRGWKIVADEDQPGQLERVLAGKDFAVDQSAKRIVAALDKAAKAITGDK